MRFEGVDKRVTDHTAKLENYLGDVYEVAENAIEESEILTALIPKIAKVTERITEKRLFAFDYDIATTAATKGFKAGLSLTWQLATEVNFSHIESASKRLDTILNSLQSQIVLGADIDEPRDELNDYILRADDDIEDLEEVLYLAFYEQDFEEEDEESRYFFLWGKVGATVMLEAVDLHKSKLGETILSNLAFEMIVGNTDE